MTARTGKRSVTLYTLMLWGAVLASQPVATAGQPASAVDPHPRSEAALRSYIAAVQQGNPDYAGMTPDFGTTLSQNLPWLQTVFRSWGEVRSLRYTGPGLPGWDEYAVAFDHAYASFSILVTADGKIAGEDFGPTAGQIPSRGQGAETPAATAHPGTETALRRLIAEIREGSPNYTQMSPGLASAVRPQLPQLQALFISWGGIHRVKFTGNSSLGWDGYDVVFDHAIASFSIILSTDGTVAGHWLVSYRAAATAP